MTAETSNARGDLQAVLQEMRERQVARRFKSQALIEWADRIERATATPPPPADAEVRARELLSQARHTGKGKDWMVAAEALAVALSQQPEARGVVDGLSPQEIERGWEATFSTTNPFCPCNLKSFTKAVRWAERALTEARNVR